VATVLYTVRLYGYGCLPDICDRDQPRKHLYSCTHEYMMVGQHKVTTGCGRCMVCRALFDRTRSSTAVQLYGSDSHAARGPPAHMHACSHAPPRTATASPACQALAGDLELILNRFSTQNFRPSRSQLSGTLHVPVRGLRLAHRPGTCTRAPKRRSTQRRYLSFTRRPPPPPATFSRDAPELRQVSAVPKMPARRQ
jgi:hypothetical protein